ncbi:GNAT family N-acetyltransferase [Bryobacter aggregatus]|uniref:GNAT family N-acetyltransferase n=1 Tax=Bryobacter aggregatus TaxID=360054 RepID=UPI0004E2071F|nr:GNAT family N-acetyltransferase [Bryobacter aggregatus]
MERERALLVANLFDMMRTFAGTRPGAAIWEEDELLCVYSGLPGAVFNSVLLKTPVRTEEELKIKLAYADALFRRQDARWSLWLVEHFVPDQLLGRVGRLVERYGLTTVLRGAGMVVEELTAPSRVLPQLEIRPVQAPAARFDFCHVMSVAFRTPLATFLDVYQSDNYWKGPLQGYVAYSGTRAVGTACVLATQGVVGIYGVSVLPDVQRKGIGQRLVRYVLDLTKQETGLSMSVLESSEAAMALYQHLGYRRITGVSVYNESR